MSSNNRGQRLKLRLDELFQNLDMRPLPTRPLTVEDEHDQRFPKIFVLGQGSMMSIHFSGPDKALLQGLYFHHVMQRGIYVAQRGFIALTIEITEEHVQQFVQATKEFVDKYLAYISLL